MKKRFLETIDGSLKNIIQLKTLDNSLEFSQMFDALQDTPRDFQTKLLDALNSLSQTMGVPPDETFNKVLCASDDEDPDVKKKMYSWWRAFFEVLGKVVGNMPKDRSAEFTEKIDALMAEIMKSGDKEASGEDANEVVLEDYEEADKSEEDDMLKDFDFAVQHIGEIANKVKDIVNFINPYCESIGGTSKMNEDEVRDFVKAIGFRPDSDGIDYETQLVDALTGKDTSYNAGWGAVYYNSDKVLQFLKKYGMLGSRGIKQKEAISKLKRLFKSGKWKEPEQQEFDLDNEVETTMKKTNERGGSDWVSMDDMIGMEVGESDDDPINWDDEDSYNDGGFEKGMWVIWTDPDSGEESVWKILEMPKSEDDYFVLGQKDGSISEVPGWEIRPRDSDPEEYKESWYPEHGIGEVVSWKDENDEMQDGWKVIGCDVNTFEYHLEKDGEDVWVDDVRVDEYNESKQVNEASVVVDANDVWEVLDLLDDETANKNLTDLINSHLRTEDEIMDAIDSFVEKTWPDGVSKKSLNALMSEWMYEIVDSLGLDVEKFKRDGQFVDPEKPVALESDWDEKPAEREEAHDKPERGTKAIVNGHVVDADSGYAEFMRIANMEPRRRHWEENSEEDKPDEVKDGEKKYKKDGETKTLVTGSDKENKTNDKQEVTEMTIEQEVTDPWKLLEMLWGQGRENLRELLESELFDDEFVMQMIEDMEIRDLTAINDAFAFDFETILDMFGCDPHAWSQNLEIKMKGDEDSEED